MRAQKLATGARALLLVISLVGASACRTTDESDGTLKDANGVPQTDDLLQEHGKAGHGMVVFGKDTIYMYHLPLWGPPHAWTIVMEVELSGGDSGDGHSVYSADRAAGSTLNTFSPKPFALEKLVPGFQFKGTLFNGHFEQGGQAIDAGVTATVKRMLVVKPLKGSDPALTKPGFRIFGHGNEWYAAHLVSHRPDFDQVLALVPVPNLFSEQQLETGVNVSLPGLSNDVGSRLQANAEAVGALADGTSFPFKVAAETYFSTSDLGE